ncbi:MAG: hypothetical protein GC164_09070 [Phycisphaera sp.]|nr:hypothetical protein [Phycisphaera sp.]
MDKQDSPNPNNDTPSTKTEGAPGQSADAGLTQPVTIEPPVSFGRQMAQLVIIPAVIVVAVLGVMAIFAVFAGRSDTLEDQLARLAQPSGSGRLPMGFQDPRYKDRSLAAMNVATMLTQVKDQKKRFEVSEQLGQVLTTGVSEDEEMLRAYLLIAIGQIGRPEEFPLIVKALADPSPTVKQGALRGLVSWPERQRVVSVTGDVVKLLTDSDTQVRAVAAMALGEYAAPGDDTVIQALRGAMDSQDSPDREAIWNSAVALARLGDERGSRYVATVLLDREALSKLPDGNTSNTGKTLGVHAVDRILLSTLAAAAKMKSPLVWDKVRQIADHDPSLGVRKMALELVQNPSQPDTPADR